MVYREDNFLNNLILISRTEPIGTGKGWKWQQNVMKTLIQHSVIIWCNNFLSIKMNYLWIDVRSHLDLGVLASL